MNKVNLENCTTPRAFFFAVHKKQLKWILLNVVFYGLGTLCSVGISFYLGKIIDSLAQHAQIKIFIILLVAVLFGREIFYRIGHVLEVAVDARLREHTKKVLFSHTRKLSFGYFADRFAGQIAHQISTAADAMERMKDTVVARFIDNIWMLLVSAVTLTFVYRPLGIVIFIWAALFLAGIWPFTKKISEHAERFAKQSSNTSGSLVDMYANIASVKVYSQDADHGRIYNHVDNEFNAQMLLGKWSVYTYLYQGISAALLGCALIFVTAYGYQHGLVTVGQIVLIGGLTIKVLSDVYDTGHSISDFIRAHGECAQALRDILLEPAVADGKDILTEIKNSSAVFYDKVSFAYGNKAKVLDGFSLKVPSGQKLGIVGLSGAGKTTLVNLLLRFYDPQEGSVFVNGIDIKTVSQDSLRSRISFISQDTSLFHMTIAENIQYGSPIISKEKIKECATMAFADEFIMQLPNQYETVVGERGVKLSGGQRQRIAIARALLKNSSLFLLDEATSALDSDSESKVQNALKILMQGKTVIAIAHRLSTLQSLDRIIFIEDGKVAEDGTHEELIQLGGKYARLWSMQAGGFLPESI